MLGCRRRQQGDIMSVPNQLFEAALGIASPWYVKGVEFDAERRKLTIGIDFSAGARASRSPGRTPSCRFTIR
jgi:hypothetical protein